MKCGFTLIELLTVMAVILVLMGISIPVYATVVSRSRVSATREIVAAFAAAAARQERLTVVVGTGANTTSRSVFDFNRDGLLDGRPDLDPAFTAALRADAASVSYDGAIATAGVTLQRLHIDAAYRPLDAWKRPLRVGIAAGVYGAGMIGIWSAGRDGLDGTEDDIRSW